MFLHINFLMDIIDKNKGFYILIFLWILLIKIKLMDIITYKIKLMDIFTYKIKLMDIFTYKIKLMDILI